ncbi:MAG: hypothetical protein AAF411_03585 [Myxococcota bacterium]
MSDLSQALERLPHAGPMRFIDSIEAVEDGGRTIVTRIHVRPDFIMAEGGQVSPLVAVEFFAQSAAALMAHRSAAAKAPKVSGALLGTRSLECSGAISVGDLLECRATEVFGAGALAQFECTLRRDGELLAKGSINVASGALPPG